MPLTPAGTLWAMGDMKQMRPEWLVGISLQGYGCSLAVGLGIPIPVLNEEIAKQTGICDEQIFTQIVDYGKDYPRGIGKSHRQVSYAELKSGEVKINGRLVPTTPLSSLVKAREIADILKRDIAKGDFLIGEPQLNLPSGR
jgi:uncharacterized protein (DUF39 family)